MTFACHGRGGKSALVAILLIVALLWPWPEPTGIRLGAIAHAAQPGPQQVASSRVVSLADTAGMAVLQGSDWLATQPGEHFTVQLLASRYQITVHRLLDEHELPLPLAQFVQERNGERLYVLTHGSYATRSEAQRAAAAMPAAIKPWVRTLSSVQAVMLTTEAAPSHPVRPSAEPPVEQHTATETAFLEAAFSGVKGDAWVWSQDPAHYTIQLRAAPDEPAIRTFMEGLSLPGERALVRVVGDGQSQYVVIYGSFDSAEAAKGTLSRLPEDMRAAKPWPRRFAGLHDEMSRATSTR